jgi:hypothetical protein
MSSGGQFFMSPDILSPVVVERRPAGGRLPGMALSRKRGERDRISGSQAGPNRLWVRAGAVDLLPSPNHISNSSYYRNK